jgi:catechol 2,3-dioxygenase-like lactoylglutathione lyase family enzyme
LLGSRVAVLGINHIAFPSHDPAALREFYLDLTGGALDAVHDPVHIGSTLLVFFESERHYRDQDADELAFNVDAAGFDDVLARAQRLGLDVRGPVAHTDWSKGFYLLDPDGRRLEFTYDDQSVYWR